MGKNNFLTWKRALLFKAAGPCDRIALRADLPRNGNNNKRERKGSSEEQREQLLPFSAQRERSADKRGRLDWEAFMRLTVIPPE